MSRNFEILKKTLPEDWMQSGISTQEQEQEEERSVEVVAAPESASEYDRELQEALPRGPEELQLTNLVQRVFLRPNAEAPRMVGFAAVEQGAGCSWVCARLSKILAAHVSGSVCAVDANLRAPGLHKQYGVENVPVVHDALLPSEPLASFARPVVGKKLWIVNSGISTVRVDAVATDRMRSQISTLRKRFDYVLLDLPPLNKYADGIVLGGVCDGIILVLRANSSRRDTATRVVNDLKTANVHVLGVILNQRTFEVPEMIYRRL